MSHNQVNTPDIKTVDEPRLQRKLDALDVKFKLLDEAIDKLESAPNTHIYNSNIRNTLEKLKSENVNLRLLF